VEDKLDLMLTLKVLGEWMKDFKQETSVALEKTE
jgi:hypothetical protein